MLFESEWPGDAIIAPFSVINDRQDETFTGLADRIGSPTDPRLNQSDETPDRCDWAKSTCRRRWIPLLFSIFGVLRSRIHPRREGRRKDAAWAMVDDRTLTDIGISRLEVEYAVDARHGD
jgi:uncharacterized protein YjiS (DUF1127 family)